jgi:transcriptional regulator with XRE-family HTH domain
MKGKRNSLKEPKEIYSALGDRIRTIRRKMNLKQKDFASSLQMSSCYLSEIEAGNGNPGVGFFHRLIKTHNVSLDYLFYGTGEMFKAKLRRTPEKEKEFVDNIQNVNDLLWLLDHSSLFRNTVMGFGEKFLYENEAIIKKNIKMNQKEK